MKIYLLFPPYWTPTMPHLALPWLTGFLRRFLRQQGQDGGGISVVQRDLNVEVFDEILSRRYLKVSLRRIRQRFPAGGAPRFPVHVDGYPDAAAKLVPQALEKGQLLAEKVEKAKAVLRSTRFYDGEASLTAFLTIVEALELTSLAYYPANLDLNGFSDPLRPGQRPDASQDLLQNAGDAQMNPFYEIFQRGILADLQKDAPDLVGISIPTQGQFLAGLTLATLIRQAGLQCHITAGGPHLTMLREQLLKTPAFFDLFDSVVTFDGELPLLRLVEALQGDGDLSKVPNLVWADGAGSITANPLIPIAEVRQVQSSIVPDFDGLPLEKYLAPEPVLPLITAHGCYHGKCGFCNVGYGLADHYYPYPVEHIASQMQMLREKYGCRHIFFVDEALPPGTMRRLAESLKGQSLDSTQSPVNWCGAVRFEKTLTDTLLEQISASGCRMLLYGLESASEPVMQRMIKGTQRGEMSRILRSAAATGIWNHAFFFFGFPGETLEDAQETVNFVYAHQDALHSASPGAFLLERDAPAYRFPKKFGIQKIHHDPQRDLAIYFDYEVAEGLDERTANQLADRLVEQLPDKRYGQFYNNDIYKLLYASELRRRGQPLPLWISRTPSGGSGPD